ncbi:hypothetical protein Ddc_16454 [Ditylenchus destructor]|nr:hypothetical protein Ddc_16454 [Ditylenchus destructor]
MASNEQLMQEILDLVEKTEILGSAVKCIFADLTTLIEMTRNLTKACKNTMELLRACSTVTVASMTILRNDQHVLRNDQQKRIEELENRCAELAVMLQEMKNIDRNRDGKEATLKSTK